MMKRVWRISDAAQAELFLHRGSAKPKTLTTPLSNLTRISTQRFLRELYAQTPPCPSAFTSIIGLFADRWSSADTRAREDLCARVKHLRDELLKNVDDGDEIARILEEKAASLFRSHSDGSASIELLKQLRRWTPLALEVFFT